MRLNAGLTNGEPEPKPGYVRLLGQPLAEEGLEDPLPIFRRNARPFVLDAQFQFVAGDNVGGDPDGGRLWRVLHRVLQQIGQHAFHPSGIDAHGRQTGRHVEAHRAIAEQTTDPVEPALDECRRTREHPLCGRRPNAIGGIGLGQCVHELGEPVGFDLDLEQEVATCRVVPVHVRPAQGADEALDVAQWQAKFVGERRQELIAMAVGRRHHIRPWCGNRRGTTRTERGGRYRSCHR